MKFTVITTYYNEDEQLPLFLEQFKLLQEKYPETNLIIVDDGSKIFPITLFDSLLKTIPNIEVYIISKDLGFNSHGARNLAMLKSATEWNALIDMDVSIDSSKIESILTSLEDKKICFLGDPKTAGNHFFIQKWLFFSCMGYDEEFIGHHYGDRMFFNYIKNKYGCTYVANTIMVRRFARKIIHTDSVSTTSYDNELGILYIPKQTPLSETVSKHVKRRYQRGDFNNKTIITFDWQRYI